MSPELAEAIFTLYVGLFILTGVSGYLQRREDPEEFDPAERSLAVINITAIIVIATWIILIFSVSMSWWHFVLRYGFFGIIPPLMVVHYKRWWSSLPTDDVNIMLSIILTIVLWFFGFLAWPAWLVLATIYSRQRPVPEVSR